MKRLAGVAILIAVTAACGSDHAPTRIVATPATRFRVVYHVVSTAGARSETWETLTVDRPFRAATLTYSAPPPGQAVNGYVSDATALYSIDRNGMHRVAGRQPGVPAGDQALGVMAPELVKRGLARYGQERVVLGAHCRDLTLFEPPVGPIKRVGDARRDHDDICIDRRGIVLRDVWTYQGAVVQERTAIALRVGSALSDERREADLSTASASESPGGAAMPTAAPSTAAAPGAPRGFTLGQTVDFLLPRADAPGVIAYGSTVFAYVRGPDVVSVERGAGAVHPWGDTEVVSPLQIRGRSVETAVRAEGAELRYLAPDGAWLRLRTTRPLAFLVAFARGLPSSTWESSSAAVPK